MGTARRRLVEGCAGAHRAQEVAALAPETICLLGRLPAESMEFCFPELRGQGLGEKTAEGGVGKLSLNGRETTLLLTYFPRNDYGRALLLCHMKAWILDGDLPEHLNE